LPQHTHATTHTHASPRSHADLQAQDRAFRIGQERDVEVYRLVAACTVEEQVYNRQLYKQQQANVGARWNPLTTQLNPYRSTVAALVAPAMGAKLVLVSPPEYSGPAALQPLHSTVVYILVGCGDPSKSRRAGVEMQRQSASECHISR
jgi:hypothetical protein